VSLVLSSHPPQKVLGGGFAARIITTASGTDCLPVRAGTQDGVKVCILQWNEKTSTSTKFFSSVRHGDRDLGLIEARVLQRCIQVPL
jgi:hypothetical protein